MGSHSVTCYPTQVNTPRLNPSHAAGTRFTYPGGMEGWVDLVDLIAPRPGVEPVTFRSRVQRSTNATTKSNIVPGNGSTTWFVVCLTHGWKQPRTSTDWWKELLLKGQNPLYQFARSFPVANPYKSVTNRRGQKSVVSIVSCRFQNSITTIKFQTQLRCPSPLRSSSRITR